MGLNYASKVAGSNLKQVKVNNLDGEAQIDSAELWRLEAPKLSPPLRHCHFQTVDYEFAYPRLYRKSDKIGDSWCTKSHTRLAKSSTQA